jgi:protein involved in polysaccharide export with SLBB domain
MVFMLQPVRVQFIPLAQLMRSVLISSLLCLAGSALLAQSAAPGTDPIFQIGDVVRITVWQNPELSGQFDIREDGTVTHPLYRSIRIAGMSLKQSEAEFRQLLLRFETTPQFVVEALFRVAMLGEVRTPNMYTLPAQTTVAQAIAMAGGPTPAARLDAVRLLREGQTILLDLGAPNSQAMQQRIISGDQIVVDRRHSLWHDTIVPVLTTLGSLASIAYLILNATGSF